MTYFSTWHIYCFKGSIGFIFDRWTASEERNFYCRHNAQTLPKCQPLRQPLPVKNKISKSDVNSLTYSKKSGFGNVINRPLKPKMTALMSFLMLYFCIYIKYATCATPPTKMSINKSLIVIDLYQTVTKYVTSLTLEFPLWMFQQYFESPLQNPRSIHWIWSNRHQKNCLLLGSSLNYVTQF